LVAPAAHPAPVAPLPEAPGDADVPLVPPQALSRTAASVAAPAAVARRERGPALRRRLPLYPSDMLVSPRPFVTVSSYVFVEKPALDMSDFDQ
jgi:hypothetical protein